MRQATSLLFIFTFILTMTFSSTSVSETIHSQTKHKATQKFAISTNTVGRMGAIGANGKKRIFKHHKHLWALVLP